MTSKGRDLPWDAVQTASQRLSKTYHVTVRPIRRHRPWGGAEGFLVPGSPDEFVAVRRRSALGRWREVQPVTEAASMVGAILRADQAE